MKKVYYALSSAVVASLILTAVPVSVVHGASTQNIQSAQTATGAPILKEVDQPVLEERGYRVGEREVKQELENLTQENFLTPHDDLFSITGAGGCLRLLEGYA